jgi:hypothetical protein
MILGRYKLYIYNYIYILILYFFQCSYKSWILNKYILIYILHHTIFIFIIYILNKLYIYIFNYNYLFEI